MVKHATALRGPNCISDIVVSSRQLSLARNESSIPQGWSSVCEVGCSVAAVQRETQRRHPQRSQRVGKRPFLKSHGYLIVEGGPQCGGVERSVALNMYGGTKNMQKRHHWSKKLKSEAATGSSPRCSRRRACVSWCFSIQAPFL